MATGGPSPGNIYQPSTSTPKRVVRCWQFLINFKISFILLWGHHIITFSEMAVLWPSPECLKTLLGVECAGLVNISH